MLASQEVHYLVGHLFRHCAIKVYLIHHRDNLQVILKRQIEIRYCLRLYALCGIYHKQGSLTGRNSARHLVTEVHRPRCINQVEHIVHLDGVTLDGDATLLLQFHVVEHLVLHIALADGVCHLQQAVGQRTLTVVNMSYYAEISYILHRCKDTLFFRYAATIRAFPELPARSTPQRGWCRWRHSRCPPSSCGPASR